MLASVRGRPLHGYALVEELRRLSEGAFDLRSLYLALHRLEREGLLSSRRSATGRARRVYGLTAQGRQVLADKERAWRRFISNVEVVLQATA